MNLGHTHTHTEIQDMMSQSCSTCHYAELENSFELPLFHSVAYILNCRILLTTLI